MRDPILLVSGYMGEMVVGVAYNAGSALRATRKSRATASPHHNRRTAPAMGILKQHGRPANTASNARAPECTRRRSPQSSQRVALAEVVHREAAFHPVKGARA